MFTTFDKASAAAIAAAITTALGQLTTLGTDVVSAIGVLLAAVLVWLVPNKKAGA